MTYLLALYLACGLALSLCSLFRLIRNRRWEAAWEYDPQDTFVRLLLLWPVALVIWLFGKE